MGGFKLTGLGTPTATTDATTKAYVDSAVTPSPRQVCRVATTANITISTALNNADTLDGISLATNDVVLVKNQTDATENGIYIADSSSWDRAPDFDGNNDVAKGSIIYVHSGTANSGFWILSTADPITIDTIDNVVTLHKFLKNACSG